VFLLDRLTGLWRSTNQGDTWTNVWNDSDMTTGGGGDSTGYLTAQVPSAGVVRLFISMNTKLWRVDNAQTGNRSSWSPLEIGAGTLNNPGPISVANGTLFITDNNNPPRFFKATNLSSGSPTVTQEDNGSTSFYSISPAALTPSGLATYWTGSAYKHYVVGNGVIKSQ
jgi:hypothetical protein